MGSGRGSSSGRRVLLSATFERIACSQVVRRLRSSAASSNARFPSRRLAPKPLVTGCFFAQHRRSQFLAIRLFRGLEMRMRVRQQSANSLTAVRSADGSRSSRSGGAVGHMQHVTGNESDTRISGKSLQCYTYCNIE